MVKSSFLYEIASDRFVKTQLKQMTIEDYANELVDVQKIAAAAGVVIDAEAFMELVRKADK